MRQAVTLGEESLHVQKDVVNLLFRPTWLKRYSIAGKVSHLIRGVRPDEITVAVKTGEVSEFFMGF